MREVEFTSVEVTRYKVGEARVSSDLMAKFKRFSARVRVVKLPKSLPSSLEHFGLADCEYVENPEALSTCRYSLSLYDVCLQSPLRLHNSLTHLEITFKIRLYNLPPSLVSLT